MSISEGKKKPLTFVPQATDQLWRIVDVRVEHDHGRAVQAHVVQGRPPVSGFLRVGDHGEPAE